MHAWQQVRVWRASKACIAAEAACVDGCKAPTALPWPNCAQLEVEVDLDMNAHANARAWHGDRKQRSAKQAKTLAANERALAVADKKAQAQLSKVASLPALHAARTGCAAVGTDQAKC